MLIDVGKQNETVFPQMYGGEGEVHANLYKDPAIKIMRGTLPPGANIGLHTHETSSEVIYILAGQGKVLYEGEYEPLAAGSCHYCPKGKGHSLINDSDDDLVFFAVVPEQ